MISKGALDVMKAKFSWEARAGQRTRVRLADRIALGWRIFVAAAGRDGGTCHDSQLAWRQGRHLSRGG
jgi:hypothetical protein